MAAESRLTRANGVERGHLSQVPVSRVCDSLESLLALEQAWERLHNLDLPMQTFAWNYAAAKAFHSQEPLFVVTWGIGDRVEAILPLVKLSGDKVRTVELLGAKTFEPADVAWGNEGALEEAFRAVATTLKHGLILRRVPAGSPTLRAVRRAFKYKALVILRPTEPCLNIALDESWRLPENKFSKRRAADIRRAKKRAEEAGAVAYEFLTPGPHRVGDLLAVAMDVEHRSWKGRAGTSLLLDAQRAAFYKEYCRRESEKGRLVVAFLRVGGKPVAMQVASLHNGKYWLHKIGYDESYARCSPGTLLLVESIRYAAERRMKSYEFLGSPEAWISAFTAEACTPCSNVYVYLYSLEGVCGFARRLWDGALCKLGRLRGEA